jgi:hypothetical protein
MVPSGTTQGCFRPNSSKNGNNVLKFSLTHDELHAYLWMYAPWMNGPKMTNE